MKRQWIGWAAMFSVAILPVAFGEPAKTNSTRVQSNAVTNSSASIRPESPAFSFENRPAAEVVDAYTESEKRAAIYSPNVALDEKITFHSNGTNDSEIKEQLKAALAAKDIVLRESGKKFLLVVTPEEVDRFPKLLGRPPSNSIEPKPDCVVPLVNLDHVPVSEILKIYAELRGKRVQGQVQLFERITVKGHGTLTTHELASAIEAALALHGMEVSFNNEGSLEVRKNGSVWILRALPKPAAPKLLGTKHAER